MYVLIGMFYNKMAEVVALCIVFILFHVINLSIKYLVHTWTHTVWYESMFIQINQELVQEGLKNL